MRLLKKAALFAAGAALLIPGLSALAASHSDAPLIKLDPQANITDVYAFIRVVNGVKVLDVHVSCRPFSNPGDGVMYEKFSDDALYSIHLTDPSTGATRARYDFKFSSVTVAGGGYKNPGTILSYGLGTEAGPIITTGDNRQNYTQSYTVTKVVGNTSTTLMNAGSGPFLVPPPNVGPLTTPSYNDTRETIPNPNNPAQMIPNPNYGRAISGATSPAELDSYTRQAIYTANSGERLFCGTRDDAFYADTSAIFDLLNPRILGSLGDVNGDNGKGVSDFDGYNVLSYSMQIPVSSLPLNGNPTIGVYASVSRPRITLRRTDGEPTSSGPWIQVNRMGNPLMNEVLVALRDKDNFNRDNPMNDAARYQTYALNPEVAFLVNFRYGAALQAAFGRMLKTTGRTDIAGIYTPDVLKVNTSTDAVRVNGQAGFSRLSFLGGEFATVGGNPSGIPAGFPNGRRIGEDVVDIALLAIANDPGSSPLIALNDNVGSNDVPFNTVFPYMATPHSGTWILHDPDDNPGFPPGRPGGRMGR
jgi:hypothetical protein